MPIHNLPYYFVLVVGLSLLTIGCNSSPDSEEPTLNGTWEVYNAFRNGRNTETLNGAEFRFVGSEKMVTNITGQFDSAAIELIDMKIHYHGREETVYDVKTFTNDSMELVVKLQGMYFLLQLQKLAGK